MKGLVIEGKGKQKRYSYYSDSGVVHGFIECVKCFAADRIAQHSGRDMVERIWSSLTSYWRTQYKY
jgi:hypothetical protein